MPNLRSCAARDARRERAVQRGYTRSVPDGFRLIQVPNSICDRARLQVRALQAHYTNNNAVGFSFDAGAQAVVAAWRCRGDDASRHGLCKHRAVPSACHDWHSLGPASLQRRPKLREELLRPSPRWDCVNIADHNSGSRRALREPSVMNDQLHTPRSPPPACGDLLIQCSANIFGCDVKADRREPREPRIPRDMLHGPDRAPRRDLRLPRTLNEELISTPSPPSLHGVQVYADPPTCQDDDDSALVCPACALPGNPAGCLFCGLCTLCQGCVCEYDPGCCIRWRRLVILTLMGGDQEQFKAIVGSR